MSEYPGEWRWAAALGAVATPEKEHTMKRRRKRAESSSERVPSARPWNATRAEKVAHARRVIQDKNYPSREILDSIAHLLAKKLKSPK
jgi:hypothetical protein